MPNPAIMAALGIQPTRTVSNPLPDGSVMVTVQAPARMNLKPQSVRLSADQYINYQRWLRKEDLIQNLLPGLSAADREILQTGIGPQDWDNMFKDDIEDEEIS
jgi:hypothetical protein